MSEELRTLWRAYAQVGWLIEAIRSDRAELWLRTYEVDDMDRLEKNYKLNEVFDSPDYLHRIKGDLLMYHADLRTQLIDALIADGDHAMGLDEMPSDPPELRIFPKDDYRRSYTNDQEDDGR